MTLENEADLGPDADPTNNLDPLADLPDADGSDDGVTVPLVLPSGRKTTFDYAVTVVSPAATRLYANVWFDWNRDGDWDDTITLPDGTTIPEWAVQNQALTLPGVGTHTVTTPPFLCWHEFTDGDLDPLWMRITLSESPWASTLGAGGAGPANGYRMGETEDYYFQPKGESTPTTYDWSDAPDARTSGYPTVSAHNGARHAVAGPWLGDWAGAPDAEADGQPDPNALGDDLDGNDDEDGVWIPPLVQGEPALIMLQVSGGGGIVQAWIDFNGDAVWQSGEQAYNGYLPDGLHTIAVTVPPSAVVGPSFARFRISTKGGSAPEGPASDGEVEDYQVSIRPTPPQLKWVQWPDLTSNGIDIRVDNSDGKTRWLADDFPCTSTNRITEVRLWGSWKNDRKGKIQKIYLTIHPDDPAGAAGPDKQNRYSKPTPEVLWSRTFGPTEFTETPYHIVRDLGEWWWDPALGQLVPGGDTEVWQVDISISAQNAFLQQGTPVNPIIYWLEVRVESTDGQFGWKTRRWPDHHQDDAVWDLAADKPAAWKELRYPKEHPYYCAEKNSIDLAFALTYTNDVIEHPTTRPGSVTQCPVVETQCPAVETRCPAVKTQCPTFSTRCPTTRTKCPPISTLCPLVATRCPTVKTKCPATATRCPPARTKCPAVQTRCPESLTKCPPTATKCPVAETTCPVVATKCPPLATRCPESLTKCPPTATVCTAVDTQCPSVQTRCPPTTTRCPVVQTQCPTAQTQCPVVATECPVSLTKCPPTGTLCHAVETQCPAVETKCPPTTTRCPTVQTQCPSLTTQCPVSLTKCPPTGTLCQVVETQCPAVETRCPASTTKCPVVQTQCPTVQTQCPPQTTQCPPVETRCPPATTRCPVVQTQCPPVSTLCPPVNTRCPAIFTRCTGPFCILGAAAAETASPPCPAIDALCPTLVVAKQ